MPLTEEQIYTVRRQVGLEPSDADLNDTFDRLGDVDEVVREILEIRAAELRRVPATFAIPGEYSQSTAENLKSLEEQLSELPGTTATGTVRIVPPPSAAAR